jgi:hypothetical protein
MSYIKVLHLKLESAPGKRSARTQAVSTGKRTPIISCEKFTRVKKDIEMRSLLMSLLLVVLGCSGGGEAIRTDPTVYPPKPDSYEMPVMEGTSERPYKEIGRVEMEIEVGSQYRFEARPDKKQFLPELKKLGRELGADALIELKFKNYSPYSVNQETRSQAVKATAVAILYTDSEDP